MSPHSPRPIRHADKRRKPPKLPRWWQVVNGRRHVLCDRELDGTITTLEREEHKIIDQCLEDVMEAYWPTPSIDKYFARIEKERKAEGKRLDAMRRKAKALAAASVVGVGVGEAKGQ